MFWLFKWQNFPLFYAVNMDGGCHSNMAAVGNNKSILWGPQNSIVIFTFKEQMKNVKRNIMNAF